MNQPGYPYLIARGSRHLAAQAMGHGYVSRGAAALRRRYLDEIVWRFNRRSRPATFQKLLGLAIIATLALLGVIRTYPLNHRGQIRTPSAPVPGKMPTSMLATFKKQRFKNRKLLPPEDYDDEA